MKQIKFRQGLLGSLFACAATLILNGCAVGNQLKQNFQEAIEFYPQIESLNSDAQHTGLLLVDAVKNKVLSLSTLSLSGVAIVSVNNPEKMILSGSFKTGGFLSQNSDVVVFSGLQPGGYKIVKINIMWNLMWETLYMPAAKEFEIEIGAGKATYLGQINVEHPMFSTDRIIKITYNKERELESWKMVNEKFHNSTWTEIINAKIQSLL